MLFSHISLLQSFDYVCVELDIACCQIMEIPTSFFCVCTISIFLHVALDACSDGSLSKSQVRKGSQEGPELMNINTMCMLHVFVQVHRRILIISDLSRP